MLAVGVRQQFGGLAVGVRQQFGGLVAGIRQQFGGHTPRLFTLSAANVPAAGVRRSFWRTP
jgi:hypothetical protein